MLSHCPIILFNLLPLTNPRFATGDFTGWDTATLSTNGSQSIPAGSGFQVHPRDTARMVRQNTSSSTVGNKAICVQRMPCDELADVLGFHGGYLGAAAMFKADDSKAEFNATIELKIFDNTGTSTLNSGVEIDPEFEDKMLYQMESDWGLYVHKVKCPATAEWAEVRLTFEITDSAQWDSASYGYWSNVFVGGIADLVQKGFNKISIKPHMGYKTNIGDGVSEVVRVSKPSAELAIDLNKVVAGTDADRDIQCLLDSMAMESPHGCAIWASRLLHTSRGRHWAEAIPKENSPQYSYPPGVTMRNYKLKFLLPAEY